MKIAEVFYSIQGEGTLSGVPSVFIRTSGCNLRCVWCDTPYTSWTPEGEDWTLERILEEVRRDSRGYVVVTGGEPMIQPEMLALSESLRSLGQHITIETAGTVFQPVACDLMSISPKLKNSVPLEREEGRWAALQERTRYQKNVLTQLMTNYDYQLKFVVRSEDDVEEVNRMVAELEAPRGQVLLMPEGTQAALLRERSEWVVEACKRLGYRYSPRLHVDLWGDRRGV